MIGCITKFKKSFFCCLFFTHFFIGDNYNVYCVYTYTSRTWIVSIQFFSVVKDISGSRETERGEREREREREREKEK